MLLDDLKQVLNQNKDAQPQYLRNLLKETLQLYVMDFLNQSAWNRQFIMKGGTALRFCFDLPRLSEDLDFDITDYGKFSLNQFVKEIESYFHKKRQYVKMSVKTANNQRTIYLKFPVLKELNLAVLPSESNILHVRIDIAEALASSYTVEISVKSARHFSFLIRRYSQPDLFAGKLAAILTRETLEGKVKTARVKGRDYYDLIWFLEKKITPNWQFVWEITHLDRDKALQMLDKKVKDISPSVLKDDLLPFFENNAFVNQFVSNYQNIYQQYRQRL